MNIPARNLRLGLVSVLIAICVSAHAGECYSDGVRVGTIQKFSQKGIVNKSWEGELVMDGVKLGGNSSGIRGGNVWRFSVLDAAVAKTIDEATLTGAPVALRYCQVLVTLLQTDTPYRITQAVIRKN